MSEIAQPGKRRRPGRKEELIAVAARLFATRGYRSVGIDDIGEALGLTGPAIYRHFPSKEALLVAVFDGVISNNLVRIREIVAEMHDPEQALKAMIAHHCRFVLEQTENLTTWRQEAPNLPENEGRRLRRLQRMYVEEWVHVISELRPDLSDVEVRTVAHAAITLLQSPTEYHSGLDDERMMNVLAEMALAAIEGAPPAGGWPAGRRLHNIVPLASRPRK
jgi:AcrR family transcriptional regulator